MYLVTGLGNPGEDYRDTRHNSGFMVVERWASELGVQLSGGRFESAFAEAKYRGELIILQCPLTFMNRSGRAVKSIMEHYRISPDRFLLIHDDIDLPVGRLKVSFDGGSGGHRGVQSVIDSIGTRKFNRLKIGVGRPLFGEEVEDFVLSPFYPEDRDIMEKVLRSAIDACSIFITDGIEPAMNQINCLNFQKNKEV